MENMISQSDEKLFEEISLMPTIEACKTIVKEFWEKGDNDRIIRYNKTIRVIQTKKVQLQK